MRLRPCGPVLPSPYWPENSAFSWFCLCPSSDLVRVDPWLSGANFGANQSWSRHLIPDKALAAVPRRFLLGKLAKLTRDRAPMVWLLAFSRAEVASIEAFEVRSRNVATDVLRALLANESKKSSGVD
jgi:hypothetical protein